MSQQSPTNSEGREFTPSSSIAAQQSRFDTFSLQELLQIVDEGMDSDGAPLTNNDLNAIQARIVCWRRLHNEVQGAKNDLKRRDRGNDDVIEGIPDKRIDIKYDEVESLTLKSSFRAWTDWKADLERVWAGATWKYQRDNLKIIKAVSKMDKACRARWNAYVRINPDKDSDYAHFLGWTRTLVRNNVSFETTVYEEYEKATQRNNQSPVDFDAYLSSIERELPEVPDSVQANRFYAKLNEDVVKQIKISGLQTLPNTRTGMVALAQRVWEGLRTKRRIPAPETKNADTSALLRQSQQSHQRNKFHNGYQGRQSFRDVNKPGSNNDSGNHRGIESNGHKEKSPKTEKRELTCYSCGGAGHIQRNCPRKDEQAKSKLKPRIQQQRVVQSNQASSDDESGNEQGSPSARRTNPLCESVHICRLRALYTANAALSVRYK
ncbi:hypothetical protein V1520DRAFT_387482 [Lipomyces starkeyi]|uniref:CCHC-type domain-containing protein n=1 Tax=Lipomyces starkeyi NRRL Y-11557 TaxID=675824 RepID=A0A1E3Q376_LIPST|nr:hypothetical protein LIPSTDRAFT_319110 [Lipomyces starkeyi NRRL Y-11557]